jgi:hypothetical protein
VGLLAEDVEAKFMDTYLTRMWNPKAIISNMPVFKEKLRGWADEKVRAEIGRVGDVFDKRVKAVERRVEKDTEVIKKADARIKEIISRAKVAFDYRKLTSVQDDYLEFLKSELGLEGVGNYINKYGLEETAELVNMAKAKIPKRPESLTDAIRKKGGIKDDADLKSRDITRSPKRGMFTDDGVGLDVMLRELIDDDFFPEYRGLSTKPEDFMVDDLRRAIEEDLHDTGVYRDSDYSLVEEIEALEALRDDAVEVLGRVGITDYKNFYKNIYEDVKLSKRDLRKETKLERERIKAARQGAREAQKVTKEFRDELKRMRNAEVATLKRTKKKAETRIRKNKVKADNISAERAGDVNKFLNANDDGISEYVDEVVDQITDQLSQLKHNPDLPPHISPVLRGPLKDKLLDVNDVDFEEFLENDIRNIMDYYRHMMGTQIETQRKFGATDLSNKIEEIEEEYRGLMDAATTEKKRGSLAKQRKNVVKDITGVRDIMQGTYNKHHDPDSVFSQSAIVLRDLQFMSKMGAVTLSSLPDVFRAPMISGFSNTLDAVSLKGASTEIRKMATADLEEAALEAEAVLASRMQTMAEIGDPLNRGTALTRFTGAAAQTFSKVTLLNYWNDMQKSIAGLAQQIKLIKALKVGGDTQHLLEAGIDDFHANIIRKQIAKHGDGERVAGLKDWDLEDPNVAQAHRLWRASLNKEANTAVVTKSAGDLPLYANTPTGRVLLQFRTFMIASHNRVLLRGLQTQQPEAAGAVMGATAMVGMGMAVAAMKAELASRSAGLRGTDNNFDISTWNKRKWLVEGIDRSGLIALMLEPINIADKAAGLGPSLITGQGVSSRYASRNTFGALMGPTAGTVADAALATRALASPITGADISKSDIYAARKLMPFQNAFVFRQMFDILERETGEAVGAK